MHRCAWAMGLNGATIAPRRIGGAFALPWRGLATSECLNLEIQRPGEVQFWYVTPHRMVKRKEGRRNNNKHNHIIIRIIGI